MRELPLDKDDSLHEESSTLAFVNGSLVAVYLNAKQ